MKSIPFCIEKFSYVVSEEQIDVSSIPPLVRRKLSLLDKVALTTMVKLFEPDKVDEIVFSSEFGEFSRLDCLIEQYQEFKETSPAVFSASVHNYLVGFFTQFNKLDIPYYALSSGENSLSAGLIKSINKRTLFTYADVFGGIASVSCLINPNKNKMEFLVGNYKNYNFEAFIEFLNGNRDCFMSEFGIFRYSN